MNDVLWFNGRFATTADRLLSVEDRGFLFGDAVYEVFKFLGRRPVFLGDHRDRLAGGLRGVEIPDPWTDATFKETMASLLERTTFDDGIVYIEVSRGEGERAHFYAEGMTPTALAYSRQFRFPDSAKKERGVRLLSTPDLRWKRCDLKVVNLLPNAMAKKQAQRAGADEALLVDGGVIRECASSSFFIVSGGVVITHPLGPEILPGVTRRRTLALAERFEERPIREEELRGADEIFITSTTLGVMPVRQIDDGILRERGPVTFDLQRRLEEEELRSASEWQAGR